MKPLKLVLIAVVSLGLLALASYLFLDERLFHHLLEHKSTFHENDWLSPIRELGKAWVPAWLMLILLLTTKQVKPAMVALLAMLLIIPMIYTLKPIVARQRPAERAEVLQHPDAEHRFSRMNTSFPSGDSATAFAIAAALTPFAYRAKRRAFRLLIPAIFTFAGLVAIMRVTVLKHYPSDVCAGAAIGLLAGYFAYWLIDHHPNLRPHLYTTPLARLITLALIFAMPFLANVEGVNPFTNFLGQYGWLVLLAAAAAAFYTCRAERKTPTQ